MRDHSLKLDAPQDATPCAGPQAAKGLVKLGAIGLTINNIFHNNSQFHNASNLQLHGLCSADSHGTHQPPGLHPQLAGPGPPRSVSSTPQTYARLY